MSIQYFRRGDPHPFVGAVLNQKKLVTSYTDRGPIEGQSYTGVDGECYILAYGTSVDPPDEYWVYVRCQDYDTDCCN